MELQTNEDWKKLYQTTGDKPLLLIKHSTTCPISAEAYKEFQTYEKSAPNEATYALVKVIEQRPVSNVIAEDTGIKHESPQCLLIRNKKVVWSDSHWSITQKSLQKAMNK
jgi:bacillithiol system protein YtxJ